MRRILYLSRGGSFGGSQKQLYYLLKGLDGTYSPIVVCTKEGDFFTALNSVKITAYTRMVCPWRKFPKGLLRYWDAEQLTSIARRHNVCLVHCSELWLSGYMRWIAMRLNVPSVLHIRTPITPKEVRKHKCSKATALIAISRRVRRNLLEAGIAPRKITRIHDSVDLNVLCPQENKPNVLRQDFKRQEKILVGLVGRIESLKQQLEFLKAVKQVLQRASKQVAFFLIGAVHDRDYYDQLEEYIHNNGIAGKIIFTGHRNDMPTVLNSLDFLVTLSGGSVMFEAAACGKPVIAAYLDRRDDKKLNYLRFRPILPAQTLTGLVDTILWLINDSQARERVGFESRNWAIRSFDPKVMAVKTQNLYNKLVPP